MSEPRSGVFTFYREGGKGQPIRFELRDDVTRDEFVRRACADIEIEGFAIQWDAPAQDEENKQ